MKGRERERVKKMHCKGTSTSDLWATYELSIRILFLVGVVALSEPILEIMFEDGCPTATATEDIFAVPIILSHPTLTMIFKHTQKKKEDGCPSACHCSSVVAQPAVATPVSSSLLYRASPALCCRDVLPLQYALYHYAVA
jgi:hypothetical protein